MLAGRASDGFRRKTVAYASGSLFLHRLLNQVEHFLNLGVLQAFTLGFEGFGDMNGDILHSFMRFFRAAEQHEFFSFRDALMAIIVVEANADEADEFFGFFFDFSGHGILPLAVRLFSGSPL
jgi:hypothetical protein